MHEVCADMDEQRGQSPQDLSHFGPVVLRSKAESNRWLIGLAQTIVAEAFENDLAALVLLAYKFSTDLVLHRCTLLAKGSTALLPSPITVMAIKFIGHAHHQIATSVSRHYPESSLQVLRDCMAWPMWVLSWITNFTCPDKVRAIAIDAGFPLHPWSPSG